MGGTAAEAIEAFFPTKRWMTGLSCSSGEPGRLLPCKTVKSPLRGRVPEAAERIVSDPPGAPIGREAPIRVLMMMRGKMTGLLVVTKVAGGAPRPRFSLRAGTMPREDLAYAARRDAGCTEAFAKTLTATKLNRTAI